MTTYDGVRPGRGSEGPSPLPHLEYAVQWLVWYGDRNHPYVDLCEIWPSQQHLWWPWTRTMISFRPRYFQGGCWDHWAHPLYWTEPPPGLPGGVPPRWGQLHLAGALGAWRLSRGLVTRHYPFSVERYIIVLIMIMSITPAVSRIRSGGLETYHCYHFTQVPTTFQYIEAQKHMLDHTRILNLTTRHSQTLHGHMCKSTIILDIPIPTKMRM